MLALVPEATLNIPEKYQALAREILEELMPVLANEARAVMIFEDLLATVRSDRWTRDLVRNPKARDLIFNRVSLECEFKYRRMLVLALIARETAHYLVNPSIEQCLEKLCGK